MPDRDIDLGIVEDDDIIAVEKKVSARGVHFDFKKVPREERWKRIKQAGISPQPPPR